MNQSVDLIEELEELIFELQSQDLEGEWVISFDRIITILNLKKESFYRELYNLRRNYPQSTSLKEFSNSDVELLCLLLNQIFKSNQIEEIFEKAGLYFTESSLSELEIYFKIFLQNILRKHKLDKELLQLLVASTKTFDDAFNSYYEDKFELDFLINRAVQNFISDRNIEPNSNAENILKKYLLEKVQYKKISIEELTDEYKKRFYYEMYGRHKREVKMDSQKKILLDYFGLDETSKLSDLKKKFKEMLLIYHPDVNKEGHEKTQEIIENYNKLFELIR